MCAKEGRQQPFVQSVLPYPEYKAFDQRRVWFGNDQLSCHFNLRVSLGGCSRDIPREAISSKYVCICQEMMITRREEHTDF